MTVAHINRIGTAVPGHDVHEAFIRFARTLPAGPEAGKPAAVGAPHTAPPAGGDGWGVILGGPASPGPVLRCGGGAPSTSPRASSQSPSASVWGRLKRRLSAFSVAPRTGRPVAMSRHVPVATEQIKNAVLESWSDCGERAHDIGSRRLTSEMDEKTMR